MKEVTTHQHDMITFLYFFLQKRKYIFTIIRRRYDGKERREKKTISNLKR